MKVKIEVVRWGKTKLTSRQKEQDHDDSVCVKTVVKAMRFHLWNEVLTERLLVQTVT
jgi:hypothetical protein